MEAVRRRRSVYMGRRKRPAIPIASMVGYTNAGKSTLLNSLSNSKVTAEDLLLLGKRLGHASVATTGDAYGHLLPGWQKEAANSFAEAMKQG